MDDAEPIDNALFEGMFVVALDVSGALEDELRRLGYDRRRQRPSYAGAVLVECLRVTRQQLHPTLSETEGLRALGRAFVGGFRQTILGRVVTTAMPLLGPARFLPRISGRFQGIRRDATVTFSETGASSGALTFADPLPLGYFFAGVIEAAVGLARGTSPKVEVTAGIGGYVLAVSW